MYSSLPYIYDDDDDENIIRQVVYGNPAKINILEELFPSLQSLCINKLDDLQKYISDQNKRGTLEQISSKIRTFNDVHKEYDWKYENEISDEERINYMTQCKNQCTQELLAGNIDTFKCRLKLSRIVYSEFHFSVYILWELDSIIWKPSDVS